MAGRPQQYDEPKKRHNVSVTDPAWEGLANLAVALGYGDNISALLEAIGRGEVKVQR